MLKVESTIWIGTSWKMNKRRAEALQFAEALRTSRRYPGIQPFVIPPFPYLQDVVGVLADSGIHIGAQNMHWADDAEALNNLAHVLLALKDPGALKAAERALALRPAAAHIIGTVGWVSHKAGQNDRALQHLRDARLRNPDSAETRYYLGATLAAMGRTGEAKTELAAAVNSSRPFASKKDAEALLSSLK